MVISLNKLSEREKLQLCRRYFLFGFAFLPILWLVNIIWFYRYTYFMKYENSENDETQQMDLHAKMKCYVLWSAIGTVFWSILITSWIYIYQINRSFGSIYWAEWLTYIYPLGYV